ncbi:hypothetical protein GCM10009795_024720 [Nocardioides hankookensis]|uniref:Zinc-binding alcohol dehydrogenase family protein n=1 Tax=Nocardioides hankookensis TaxID=443157 RepID=A0ABW1LEQ0_9ACTN
MHAIRHHRTGAPDVLVLEELPDLEPAPGQVRIAVEAARAHADLEGRRALGKVVLVSPR